MLHTFVQRRSFAFRGLLSARSIEGDSRADERLKRIRVNLLTLVNVDGAPCVPSRLESKNLAGSFKEAPLRKRP
jgi:hypothetical protein